MESPSSAVSSPFISGVDDSSQANDYPVLRRYILWQIIDMCRMQKKQYMWALPNGNSYYCSAEISYADWKGTLAIL